MNADCGVAGPKIEVAAASVEAGVGVEGGVISVSGGERETCLANGVAPGGAKVGR